MTPNELKTSVRHAARVKDPRSEVVHTGVDILGYFVGEPSQLLEVAESRTFHGVHASEFLGEAFLSGRTESRDAIER